MLLVLQKTRGQKEASHLRTAEVHIATIVTEKVKRNPQTCLRVRGQNIQDNLSRILVQHLEDLIGRLKS